MPGILYVVATPIGNLGDVTRRAVEVLGSVDCIAAEDTRVSRKLLNHLEISTKMISYHDKNEKSKSDELISLLLEGKNIAQISDAGTPGISDPGYRLVNGALNNGIKVVSVPGASSITAALSVSGLPTDHFFFEGFLPKKKGRKTRFEFLESIPATIVVFESPFRVKRTLNDIFTHFGDRSISICREITKMYEEVWLGKVSDAVRMYEQKSSKGEFVILIAKEGYSHL
jgi:16S rRNA (cytidine1402-2'-O)-methyltransferase